MADSNGLEARVTELEKALEVMRARVKELEETKVMKMVGGVPKTTSLVGESKD